MEKLVETREWREAEHGKVDHKESSDDEEVVLISRRKGVGPAGGRISVIHQRRRTLS